MLAKVVRLIEDAQVAKAPIQAYADRVSAVFVPVVVVLATLTWVFWYGRCRSR
jgi:Cu+-exporting ATPase